MFQQWCGFSISIGKGTGIATEPWISVHMADKWYKKKPPQVTALTVGLPVTSERCWRGVELGCLTMQPLFAATCICLQFRQAGYRDEEFFCVFLRGWEWGNGLTLIWWGTTQLQCIYYLVPYIMISRPLRVFRCFKCRSCFIFVFVYEVFQNLPGILLTPSRPEKYFFSEFLIIWSNSLL